MVYSFMLRATSWLASSAEYAFEPMERCPLSETSTVTGGAPGSIGWYGVNMPTLNEAFRIGRAVTQRLVVTRPVVLESAKVPTLAKR